MDWRKREIAFEQAYPGKDNSILVVIEASTPEQAAQAQARLATELEKNKDLFPGVVRSGAGQFFEQNGLLFLPQEEVEKTTGGLAQADQLVGVLAADPSLRGLTDALRFALAGVQRGATTLDQLAPTMNAAAETVEKDLAGQPASFSWHGLLRGKLEPGDLRRFIQVQAKLDFSALEPGKDASDAIRKAARDLNLAETLNARVRLTGAVPIADEEFATVQEGFLFHTVGMVFFVLLILWLALHSGKLIFAVLINMFLGLAITAALGLLMVGSLNLISIAFAVLFVGLGVDFGIQFAVRYRAARFASDDLREALAETARSIGSPLTLAAAAVAAGFLSFLPTAYSGVSELGQIAGVGMLIAFLTSVTFLPALLTLLNPAGEPAEVGYKALAPVDHFLERHRIGVLAGTALCAIGGLPLLFYLTFDFNPINLRSPKVESIATFLDLRKDPNIGANAINVLLPSQAEAEKVAEGLGKLPEVERAMTVANFVPEDQEPKLKAIRALAEKLEPALNPDNPEPPPTDAENVESLNDTATALEKAAEAGKGIGADAAKRLAAALKKVAASPEPMRASVTASFIPPLQTVLGELRNYLKAEPVTLESLPQELKSDWITKDGRARAEAIPKGDPNDNDVLRAFARSVVKAYPNAIGGPISILESGNTIVNAFIQAGIWALLSIAILLWIVLRRISDVLLTLVPLLVAGVLTLEICVLIGMPLNFANIIALPLLLGVGVAFKIYYIMAWRAGQGNLLQSSLTRAVIWSALASMVAFGSLWLSSHPGTSSMGKLLALSLATTLCAAVLFQPALMGKPREVEKDGTSI
ncbi:hypothetical protein FHS46_004320 [Variibacter gotjawalensis]|nr:hypothetical protein [Variibacter gotjawalensis]